LGGVIGINYPNAMHLVKPDGISGQQPAQDLSIFVYNLWHIPCTQT
jgi:hypothetical protein